MYLLGGHMFNRHFKLSHKVVTIKT